MPYLQGPRSELDTRAYAGVNTDQNTGRRNVSLSSVTGSADDETVLELKNVGWAHKVVVWPRSGTLHGEISVDGTNWQTVFWRSATSQTSNVYDLVASDAITGGIFYIDGDGPTAPFVRFRQNGATAARADVFIQA